MSVFRSTVARPSRRSRAARRRHADTRMRRAVSEALEPRIMLSAYMVTTTGDDAGNVAPTLVGGVYYSTTLRDAITFATGQGHATINFALNFNTPQTITLTHQDLHISSGADISIVGPGAGLLSISGNNASRVLRVDTGTTVTVQGLTITDGNSSNEDYRRGGGVYNSGILTLQNCTVSGNSAARGGGVENYYSHAYSHLSLIGCTISGNKATGGPGGGIENYGRDGQLGSFSTTAIVTLSDCTISGNTATGNGGGIYDESTVQEAGPGYVYTGYARLSPVIDCTISGNTAGGIGGGIDNQNFNGDFFELKKFTYDNQGTHYIGTFAVSAHAQLTLVGCTVNSNSASTYGGGIVASNSVMIANCTISGNNVSAGNNRYQDAISGVGGGIAVAGQLTITDSTISGNTAARIADSFLGDGGIALTYMVTHPTAPINGHAATPITLAAELTIDGSIVSGNSSVIGSNQVADDFDGLLSGEYTTGSAGGSYNLIGADKTGQFSNGVSHNIVGINNPMLAPLGYYGGLTQTMAPLPGSPAINAGSVFNGPDNSPITTDQRGFTRPQNTTSEIGAFQAQHSPLVVNTNADDAPTASDPVHQGQLSLRDAVNLASAFGGNQPIDFESGPGTINLNGTALSLADASGTITIQGPGAANLTINGQGQSTVFANFANDSAVITGLTITGGHASFFEGGAISNTGNLTLNNDVIMNSSAHDGGGIYSSPVSNGVLAINNTTIKNCTATNNGGGIYSTGQLQVFDSTLNGNSASLGGALNVGTGFSAVANSTISGNTASQGGGGVYDSGLLTFTDATISLNYCGPSGAKGGGGIFSTLDNAVVLIGTIIDGNTSHPVNSTIPDDLEGQPDVGLNDLVGSDGTHSISNNVLGNIIAANPKLGPLASNGGPTQTMALLPGSPAIDAGTYHVLFNGQPFSTDQRGKSRPQGAGPDIGAYEFIGPTNPIVVGAKSHVAVVGHVLTQFVVAMEQGGQIDPGNNSNITLRIFSGPSANLNGQPSITIPAVQGQAIFNNITFDSFGTYILQADDGINPPVLSPPITFNSVSVPVAQLAFDPEGQPGTATAGQPMNSPVIVDVNLNGGLYTGDVSFVSLYLNGSATSLATVQITSGTGQAMFNNLTINQIGTGDTLTAKDGNYVIATSQSFNVNAPAPITTLAVNAPETTVAGSTISPITVTVSQNPPPAGGYNSHVTLSILSGPNGASLGAHTTAAVDNVTGVATFNQLIPNIASGSTPYVIQATDSSSGATTQFSLSVTAAPNKLVFYSQFAAGTNTTASTALPAVVVHVVDQNGNIVNYNGNVTMNITGQITNPNFAGTRTVPASNGTATFTQLFLATPGTGYQLVASDINANDTAAVSNPFNLVPGNPFRPEFAAANGIAGATVAPLAVKVDDISGNFASSDNDGSTMTLTITSGPAGAPLGQVYTAQVTNGIAAFTGIILDTAGGYGFSTTDPNIPVTGSGSLNVSAGTPTHLVFDQQPGTASAGSPIAPFTVQIQDNFNNIVTSDTSPVTVYFAGGAGTELGGIITVNAQNGVASFNSVSVPVTGTNYTLSASDDAGDTTATSTAFDINAPATIYVDQNATGGNNGLDWADAFTSLRPALIAAIPGDTIDVAQGDYTPGGIATSTFQLIDGVALQGGFQTGGANGPNPTLYPTLLDGSGVNYHVVTGTGTDASAVLNGFTIQGGHADGNGDANSSLGGGLFIGGGDPTIDNCIFSNNTAVSGGAVYNSNEGAFSTSATFDDCVFTHNTATTSAGAMYNLDSDPTLVNCLFAGNSAAVFAGALANDGSSPTVTNCTFTGNSATHYLGQGGAMANDSASDPTVTNCIFWNDTSDLASNEITDDVAGLGGSTQIVTFSDVSGSFTGAGNLNTDPLFVDPNNPTTPNFQLLPTSPCINVGSNSDPALAGVATDLAGNDRIIDTIVDMGAYETQIVDVAWTGSDDVTNWSDPANWSRGMTPSLNDAVTIGPGFGSIQVGSGTFDAFSLTAESPIEILTGSLTVAGESIFSSASLTIDGQGNFQAGSSSMPQPVEVMGTIDDNGQIVVAPAVDENAVFPANLGGNGTLVVSGPGPAFFQGNENYGGQTTISANASAYIESVSGLPIGGHILNNGHLLINAGSLANPVIAGNISGAGDVTIGTNGTPAYLMLAANTHTSTMSAVVVNAGSAFDISNNEVQINFGAPANDPVATITSELANAYNGGQWNGVSASAGVITSATAQVQGSPPRAVGIIDGNNDNGAAANQILVGYTMVGDAAKLDHHVDFNDLVAVVQNFNKTGTDWAHGNFNFGASTNFNDLVAVVQNFNKTLTPPASSSVAGTPPATAPITLITQLTPVQAAPARANPVNPAPPASPSSLPSADDLDAELLKTEANPFT